MMKVKIGFRENGSGLPYRLFVKGHTLVDYIMRWCNGYHRTDAVKSIDILTRVVESSVWGGDDQLSKLARRSRCVLKMRFSLEAARLHLHVMHIAVLNYSRWKTFQTVDQDHNDIYRLTMEEFPLFKKALRKMTQNSQTRMQENSFGLGTRM